MDFIHHGFLPPYLDSHALPFAEELASRLAQHCAQTPERNTRPSDVTWSQFIGTPCASEDLIPSLSRMRGHVTTGHSVGNTLRSLLSEDFLDEEQLQMLKAFWGHVQDEGPHSGRTTPHEAEFG